MNQDNSVATNGKIVELAVQPSPLSSPRIQEEMMKQMSGESVHSDVGQIQMDEADRAQMSTSSAAFKSEASYSGVAKRGSVVTGKKIRKSSSSKVELIVDHVLVRHEMAQMGASGEIPHHMNSKLMDKIVGISLWWSSIEEPERTGYLAGLVTSHAFDCLCMSVIVVNTVFVAYVADWEIKNIGTEKPVLYSELELCFTGFFLLELMLRLYVHRLYFFVNDDMNWNMFDFILVMLSVLDQALSFLLQHGRGEKGGGGGNVGFMRFLRLLKLTKIFRTFRTMRFFKDLSVLLDSFRRSLLSVIWSCVLLSLMLFIFALIFVQALADYITLEGADDFEFKSEAFRTFGSLGTSILT
jgi:hypothetical protein